MFKQELPLMYPDDADVQKVKQHIFDPFEYLMHRHKAGLLKTGLQTRPWVKSPGMCPATSGCRISARKPSDVLALVPDTEIRHDRTLFRP